MTKIIVAFFFLALAIFIPYSVSWHDSDNEIKRKISSGVITIIVLIFSYFLITGTFKSCASMFKDRPSIDYYDAPRK